ncbi:MAG: DUF2279 domain-containing protein [Kofleriaceae bacterium]|nr:DUF2279 domain-containing protein [Kofleriaceae bacterium]
MWAYFAWYHGVDTLPDFTVGGDGLFGEETYAGGSDKLGHFWANLQISRAGARLLRWGGWSARDAALISSTLSAIYFAFVEVKDGFYYQFSYGDLGGNTLGAAFAVALEMSPRLDELLDFRVEYWPSPAYLDVLRGEPGSEINTVNVAEDYSGQRYLLALHLGALAPATPAWRWSRWVDVVAGFHSDKYKPDPVPSDGVVRTQDLYLGLSLNAQGIWDDLWGGPGSARTLRKLGHGLFEAMNLPFTSLPIAEATRSPDR